MITSQPRLLFLCALLLPALSGCHADNPSVTAAAVESTATRPPNIVIFYVDDLGYGDVGSYGAVGVETPNIDRLAANGVRFTDARGDAPLLIPVDKPTLPAMLKQAGYATAVVGKWHLGLGDGDLDWNAAVRPGPLEIGFDYAFLLPATGDRVPTVYVENHQVVGLDPADPVEVSYKEKVGDRPTGIENPELLRYETDGQHNKTIVNGVSRIGYMAGGESALWVDEEFPDVFSGKAAEFIRANKDRPFFLFHSFHDIHVPRLPNPRFKGKSTMGPRGDAIVQTDWIVGALVDELEKLGIDDRTLLIFTSDNGPVLNDGYEDQAVELIGDHKPAGPYRGSKYSAFEGGTRVPTISYWPGTINPGTSDALVSQLDIYASIAELVGVALDDSETCGSTVRIRVGNTCLRNRLVDWRCAMASGSTFRRRRIHTPVHQPKVSKVVFRKWHSFMTWKPILANGSISLERIRNLSRGYNRNSIELLWIRTNHGRQSPARKNRPTCEQGSTHISEERFPGSSRTLPGWLCDQRFGIK